MTPDRTPQGWEWFAEPSPLDDESQAIVTRAFARCFAGSDGDIALAHLKRTILDRRCPPSASDAELRHLEGQRTAIAHVCALVVRGQTL